MLKIDLTPEYTTVLMDFQYYVYSIGFEYTMHIASKAETYIVLLHRNILVDKLLYCMAVSEKGTKT